jgi:hypothetical protein
MAAFFLPVAKKAQRTSQNAILNITVIAFLLLTKPNSSGHQRKNSPISTTT